MENNKTELGNMSFYINNKYPKGNKYTIDISLKDGSYFNRNTSIYILSKLKLDMPLVLEKYDKNMLKPNLAFTPQEEDVLMEYYLGNKIKFIISANNDTITILDVVNIDEETKVYMNECVMFLIYKTIKAGGYSLGKLSQINKIKASKVINTEILKSLVDNKNDKFNIDVNLIEKNKGLFGAINRICNDIGKDLFKINVIVTSRCGEKIINSVDIVFHLKQKKTTY